MARSKRNIPSRRSVSSERKRAPSSVDVKRVQDDFEARLELKQNRIRFGPFVPRNESQAELWRLMQAKRLVFITGPSGTSKTFSATSYAAEELIAERIDSIIITRPQEDCDEEMGFLPGDEYEKFESWLGPFMDVLEGKLGKAKVMSYLKFGQIQARPLGKMRGSTFRNSIVILDEAQNTTVGQMKMFLTRIGEGAKVIINGDVEQCDLPSGVRNGLEDALSILSESRSVGFHAFGEEHITRDPLVREVLSAYRSQHKGLRKVA